MSLILNHKFKPLYLYPNRYFILTGGRGSSKSFHVSTFATQLSYEAGHRVLYTRYTLTSAKDSIVPEFTEKIDLMGVNDHFSIQNNDIKNMNSQSDILFRGIKTSSGVQTAKLKSLNGITTWILDEAEELSDEDTFDKIDLSIRSNSKQNRVILVLNPTTKEHWIWKRWFENSFKYIDIDGQQIPISTHPEVCHIHTTYLDNKDNLPKDFLDRVQDIKETSESKYRHVILGGWLEKAEGVVFENWEEGEFDLSLPYGYGMDFGYSVDPTAMVKVAVNSKTKTIYIDEQLYAKKLSSQSIVSHLSSINKTDLIVADCADPRLIDEIHYAGHNIQPCEKGVDSVKLSISNIQDYKIIVTPTSHNIKKELNNYVWSDRKAGIPVDKYNHALDAVRYIFSRLEQPSSFYFG